MLQLKPTATNYKAEPHTLPCTVQKHIETSGDTWTINTIKHRKQSLAQTLSCCMFHKCPVYHHVITVTHINPLYICSVHIKSRWESILEATQMLCADRGPKMQNTARYLINRMDTIPRLLCNASAKSTKTVVTSYCAKTISTAFRRANWHYKH